MFLDEVQLCSGFEAVLNGLNRRENLDIYVTGSNSKFLSSDVLTEFRGRGDEVRVYPLSLSEYVSAYPGDKYEAWNRLKLTFRSYPSEKSSGRHLIQEKFLNGFIEGLCPEGLFL